MPAETNTTAVHEQSTSTVDSTLKDPSIQESQCTDPTHISIPHHKHFSMPCFGRKPTPDPNSTEPHAKPHKPMNDICPPGTGGEVQGNGDMPIFGSFGIGDGGNGTGMEGGYPKGWDPSKPNNGMPPTPLQQWDRDVEEAQRKAWGGR